MQIKFEGKEYPISAEMWEAMNKHSQERGMTMDEYLAEAFTKLKDQNDAK